MTTSQANKANTDIANPALPTFMDHVHELKSRFFWVAICFAIASGLAYPYYGQIVSLLTKPLGDHKLYYLTPAGGLSFVIKICLYIGIIGVLPAVVYHLYRFVSPVMPKRNARQLIIYTLGSIFLAACGVLFAYFVSLPAAIHFLVNFNIDNVSAMLTVDAYFSFVMAYIIAGAILFQLPLVLLIINSINRLSPGQLMSYQRHNIVIAFLLAALLSPTPDVINQSLLALPMVAMYQLGVILVWMKNRKHRIKKVASRPVETREADNIDDVISSLIPSSLTSQAQTSAASRVAASVVVQPVQSLRKPASSPGRRRMDGFVSSKQSYTAPAKKSVAVTPKAVVPGLVRSQQAAVQSSSKPIYKAFDVKQGMPTHRAVFRSVVRPAVVRSSTPSATAIRRIDSPQRPTLVASRMFSPTAPNRFVPGRARVIS